MILHEETLQSLGCSFDQAKAAQLICCKCDYCGSVFSRSKHNVKRSHTHVTLDCCTKKECISQKRKATNQFLYGVDNAAQAELVKEKIRKTNLERYGVEHIAKNSSHQTKMKKACQEKYGVDNIFSLPETQEKIRAKHLEDYGVTNPMQSSSIREKHKKTIQLKYGVDHFSQTDDYKQKVKTTHRNRRGVDSNLQCEDTKRKIRETCLAKYGVENPMQCESVQEIFKASFLELYGVINPLQNVEIAEKVKETCLLRYGVTNPLQNTQVRDKAKQTMMNRYGVENPMQDKSLLQKSRETCIDRYGKYPIGNYGKTQQIISEWLNSFDFNFKSDYKILQGLELDLYDESLKLAIEYCGLYWHNDCSPQPRGRMYHYQKYKACLDQGIQLITIFSDEWLFREQQCRSHIKAVIGASANRVFARKCEIKEVSKEEARQFISTYHIQGGKHHSIVNFGIYYEQDLLGVMSLGKHPRNQQDIVLDRLCFKDEYQIVGGASKLFNRCIQWAKDNQHSKIISFSDNRWSLGKVYEALKFDLEKEYGPDYSYVDLTNSQLRLSKQSQSKKLTNCPEELTEFEWAYQRSLGRIWDCGKKRWVFYIGKTI